MKSVFTFCAMLFCGAAFAGETASVLNHGTPTPADGAPAAAATTEIVVVQGRRTRCANGQCKLYNMEEQSHEYVRNRLFGGHVIRKGSRTVLRPVR